MTKEREYDTYCVYRQTMVVKSEYNQNGTFEHIGQNGVGVVIGSKTPCRCVDCLQQIIVNAKTAIGQNN